MKLDPVTTKDVDRTPRPFQVETVKTGKVVRAFSTARERDEWLHKEGIDPHAPA